MRREFGFDMLKIVIVLSLFLNGVLMCGYSEVKYHVQPLQGIRLTGLGGVYYGRVEVLIRGEWGTICDDDWDDADARVVCRSVGLTGGIAYHRAWFGKGTGNITMTSVNCRGDERYFGMCRYASENCCSHREDAAAMCDNPN